MYIAALTNLSQLLALYTLVWLYVILKHELHPFRPFNKFLVVKAVVFFTFWQSLDSNNDSRSGSDQQREISALSTC